MLYCGGRKVKPEQKRFVQIMEKFRTLPMKNLLDKDMIRGEWHILSAISTMSKEKEGAGIKVSDLVKFRCVPAPAISRSLGKLEEKGMVERFVDRSDRRNTLVKLTDKGLKSTRISEKNLEECFDTVFDRFGEGESKDLLKKLDKFYEIVAEEVEKRKGK